MTKVARNNVLKAVQDWFEKISYIENQIKSLEKVNEIPLISISVFLLKTQFVEFLLKQLINSLDQHIFFSSSSSLVKVRVRTPKELETENIRMLGQILKELKKYKSDLLVKLIDFLDNLNKKRIKFTHKLYDSEGTIEALHSEAQSGIILANKTLEEIKKVNEMLMQK